MALSRSWKNTWLIGLVAAIIYIPFLGGVHLFDWDEINFAEIAREMVVLDDYLRIHVNFIPFTEKPPLFFWMQAIAMNIFGVGDYAARFPNAIIGIITLMTLYRIGEKLYNEKFGFLWAGAYFGSILPSLYFKSAIIDPWFNFFIFLGIYHLILYYWKTKGLGDIDLPKKPWAYLVWAGIFTGLGILTKGPVAYLITGLTLGVYFVYNRFKFFIGIPQLIAYSIVAFAVMFTWFGIETMVNGLKFMVEFTIRQWTMFSTPDAGHGGFPGYHFVVILVGCFPASIFLIRSHFKMPVERFIEKDFRKWMLFLFWVVLILFTIVKSKIVHYSSMTYLPLTFLTAQVIYYIMQGKVKLAGWMKASLLSIAFIAGALIIALPFLGMNIEILKPLFAQDKFALANLDADIHWSWYQSIAGVMLIAITVAFILLSKREQLNKAYITLFGGVGVFVFLTLILFIKKIEGISQLAAMEFYESKVDCNCYVEPEGFKSYGHLFYSQRPADLIPEEHKDASYKQWVLHGDINKDAYFVSKITVDKKLRENPEMEFLYEKNGFTFWKRSANK